MPPIRIAGIDVPDSRPLFLAALALHVLAGLVCIVAGLLAATARKRPGRHPRAGTVYMPAITAIFLTATVMAAMRWSHDWHLFVIATLACGLAWTGWLARKQRWGHRWRRWAAIHGTAMTGSYAALLTGFYVDNGPQLPLWNRLPHLSYWLLPTAVAIPLLLVALARNGAAPFTARRPVRGSAAAGASRSAASGSGRYRPGS